MTNITHTELARAYDRAGLAAQGITLEAALASPLLSKCMKYAAFAARRREAAQATGAPIQYSQQREAA